jgi:hypothetical protein
MQESFARIDDALIDRLFQPLADWLEHHLSLGPNRAARTGIDVASLAWIVSMASAAAGTWHDMRGAFLNGAVLVAGLWAFTTLRGVFGRGDGGKANPLRAGMQTHRMACLFWMGALALKSALEPASLASLGLLAVGLFATASVYLGACSRPPPRERRRFSAFAFGQV